MCKNKVFLNKNVGAIERSVILVREIISMAEN